MKEYNRTRSVTAMMQHLGWESLEERRARTKVINCYKIIDCLVEIPQHPHLIPNDCDTRGHNQKFVVPAVPVVAYQHSYFSATIRQWTALPARLVDAPPVDAFRACLASIQMVAM